MPKPRFEILDFVETAIGVLDLRRRELPGRPGTLVTEVMVDGELLMSSLNTVSEQALASHALERHTGGAGLRVLVGGLGLGYTAQAALASPRVEHVRVVDRFEAVLGWMRDGLLPLSGELNGNPRVEIVQGDVYAELLGPPADRVSYDLVLIDVDHTPTHRLDPQSGPFYTKEGQERVAAHLAADGVLAVWSADDDDAFAAVLDEVYPEAAREHVRWTDELIDEDEEVVDVLFLAIKC